MNQIISILNSLKSGVDFATAEGIVTNKIIDSIDIATMISMIEEEFDIEIPTETAEQIATVGDALEQIKNAIN